jgi:hypothetical protein
VTTLDRLLDLLPPPWTQNPASVVSALLDIGALELEAGQEDVDRLRRSHGFDTAYRLGDLVKVVALLGVTPLPWEDDLDLLRPRARALIDARLAGAVGKREIAHFVVDYLARVGAAVAVDVVRGLPRLREWEQAYPPDTFSPGHDGIDDDDAGDGGTHPPLRFVEWPHRTRRSQQLGALPYLYRWTERNGGVFPATPRIEIVGLPGGATAVPIVANLTTGALVGWRGVVGTGRRLVIRAADDDDGDVGADGVVAELDDEISGRRDVSGRLFSVTAFTAGAPFGPDDVDDEPRLFDLVQGDNELRYLNAGLYDVEGIDHVGFALAPDDLREGAFDRTTFDHSLFPAGPVAFVGLSWVERVPATFRVGVRRDVVVHRRAEDPAVVAEVADALARGLGELRAAGVVAELELRGMREQQRQTVRVALPWVRLPPQQGPSGDGERLAVSARFGDSPLGDSRFS